MRVERIKQTLEAFKVICLQAASLSEDSKHKVGAIIFRKNFQSIPAVAYNGNYSGGPNERDSEESGQSGFIHAEINAIARAGLTPENAHAFAMMVSLAPCKMCAKVIINAGIKSVFILQEHRKSVEYKEIFERAGVEWMVVGEPDEYAAYQVVRALGQPEEADRLWRESLKPFLPIKAHGEYSGN